jgi:hypothetical protein
MQHLRLLGFVPQPNLLGINFGELFGCPFAQEIVGVIGSAIAQ